MRKQEHLLIGVVLFGLYSIPILIFTPITVGFAFFGCIIAAVGSVMPDVIEPAYDYTHRGYFHSTGIMRLNFIIFIITGLIGFLTIFNGIFYYSYLISGLFLGYGAHLLADSTTKMSIPESDLPLPSIKLPKIKMQKLKKIKDNETPEDLKIEAISWKEQGNSLYKKGNYEEALSCYDKGLENDPGNPDIVHNKKMVLSRLGRVK